MARRLIIVLLIVNGLFLPLGCLPLAVLTAPINPLVAGFITPIHITNGGEELIRVTPIGARGPDGTRAPLPIYDSIFPARSAATRSGFPISPGDTRTILFDYDDTQLSEIVVETADGHRAMFIADDAPTRNQYRAPNPNVFTIASPRDLPALTAEVTQAFEAAAGPPPALGWTAWLLLPCLTFLCLLIVLFSHQRDADRGLSTPSTDIGAA